MPLHIDDQMIKKVKGKMKKRVEYVKHRFDQYLELLMQEVGITNPEKPLMYKDLNLKKLSVASKYKLLQTNEKLVQTRKAKRALKVMRMKGIT